MWLSRLKAQRRHRQRKPGVLLIRAVELIVGVVCQPVVEVRGVVLSARLPPADPGREGTSDASLRHSDVGDNSQPGMATSIPVQPGTATSVRTGIILVIKVKLALDPVNPLTAPTWHPHEALGASTATAPLSCTIALMNLFDETQGSSKRSAQFPGVSPTRAS